MNQSVADLIALIAIVAGLEVAYGKAFSTYQQQIARWLIDAARVPSRYRGLVNLGAGVAIATAFTVIGAVEIGQPGLIAVGVLAGLFASVEAARVHDQRATSPPV